MGFRVMVSLPGSRMPVYVHPRTPSHRSNRENLPGEKSALVDMLKATGATSLAASDDTLREAVMKLPPDRNGIDRRKKERKKEIE